VRPRLLERLYPYLARSPVAQQAMAREFFGRGREHWGVPGFAHQTRWQSAAALQRLFHPALRAAAQEVNVVERLLSTLPAEFHGWPFLAQDQYIEVRTLLSGYLLSSQGDRMLMAHSVEGRFPFLDANLVELANALPASYKLRALDEKHVLKRASEQLVPPSIRRRRKQPYRAPDALAFVGPDAPEWIGEVLSEPAVADAGVFDARLVQKLWRKCHAAASRRLSNTDNMGLCGVVSTQLLHHLLVRSAPDSAPSPAAGEFRTVVDHARGIGGKGRSKRTG
jgi:asparagine synthase (glutamine-hydrolysing)